MILFTGVTNGNMNEGTAFRNMDDSKQLHCGKAHPNTSEDTQKLQP